MDLGLQYIISSLQIFTRMHVLKFWQMMFTQCQSIILHLFYAFFQEMLPVLKDCPCVLIMNLQSMKQFLSC